MGAIEIQPERNYIAEYLEQWMGRKREDQILEREMNARKQQAMLGSLQKQYESLGSYDERAKFYAAVPEEFRGAFVDPSRIGRSEADEVKAAIYRNQKEALTNPIVQDAPTDGGGGVDFSTMLDRKGAGMNPMVVDPHRTAMNFDIAYALSTDKAPTQWQTRNNATFAAQGDAGFLEANRIDNGQQMNAYQAESARQNQHEFDTKWPVERGSIEALTAERRAGARENDAQAYAATTLGDTRKAGKPQGRGTFQEHPQIKPLNDTLRNLQKSHAARVRDLEKKGAPTDGDPTLASIARRQRETLAKRDKLVGELGYPATESDLFARAPQDMDLAPFYGGGAPPAVPRRAAPQATEQRRTQPSGNPRRGAAAPRSYARTAINPQTNQKIGTNDGGKTWFDVNTGAPIR